MPLSSPRPRLGVGAFTLALAMACTREPISAPSPVDLPPAVSSVPANAPVYPGDFADPFVLVADGGYYAYATNHDSANVPNLRSSDLVHWMSAGDALPALPAWAESGRHHTWAPAVLAIGGRYVLFYTARDRRSGLQCIGRADSRSPGGPFVDSSVAPFLCQIDLGGSIDASVTHDSDGQVYVIWKNDGNCCGAPVSLWSQRLDADGRALLGSPAELLRRDRAWEGTLIEGPTMWEEGGRWRLLYAANRWDTDAYATGYGICDSPLGPCQKVGAGPVLASDSTMAGPGGAEMFTDLRGTQWIAYHAWSATAVGYDKGGVRSLRLVPVESVVPLEAYSLAE